MTTIATLCFIIKGGRVLLILKKRGVGAGKYNGPGGRMEQGESPLACAIREVQEEIGVTPKGVEHIGYNEFFAGPQPFMNVHVFTATDYDGDIIETDEAKPEWFPIEKLPLHNMWADDAHWTPLMFAGKKFSGRFIFDAEMKSLLSHELEELQEHRDK